MIDDLLEHAGDALAEPPPELPSPPEGVDAGLWEQLGDLLRRRNGFYAWDSALHVLPLDEQDRWNAADGWRAEWGDEWDGAWCFAEDAYGSQFALAGGEVVLAEAETGRREPVADSLEDWAERLLADTDYLTGHEQAKEWQASHGALPPGKRLFPKTPFMLGGEYSADNLGAVDADEAMRARGAIFEQVRDLPPGSKVNLKVVD